MDARPTAGIVGAGIAGLSAAIALRRAGWVVEAFEKSSMEHETGAAITLMTIAIAILDKWGFECVLWKQHCGNANGIIASRRLKVSRISE